MSDIHDSIMISYLNHLVKFHEKYYGQMLIFKNVYTIQIADMVSNS